MAAGLTSTVDWVMYPTAVPAVPEAETVATGYVFEYGHRIILWDVLEQLQEDEEWLILS